MRLCANENIPEDCVLRLRQAQHDVLWIREAAPGSSDLEVLARALREDRLLITFDKDFGELVFRYHHPHTGVILLRLKQVSFQMKQERLAEVLTTYKHALRHFLIVTLYTVRIRKSIQQEAA